MNRSGTAVAALGLSVFLLFTLGILISVNLATLRTRFAWTQHTEEVLLQIGSVQQNLLRLESNMRAYALTADPRHTSSWENLATNTRGRLIKLASLVSDNPGQTQKLAMLRPRIEERLARWAHIAAIGVQNNNATIAQDVRNELARDVVSHPMGKLAAELSGFRAVETELLRERQLLAERQTVLLTYLSFLIVLAAPAFGAIGLVMLLRDRHRSRDHELHLQLEHSQRLNL
ncbi:MAG TPA: CHASE3 domain-containing protein, partial [Rhizomicrobium sp.]|nr:CHASE3 domain-containing protein [Rhizomicrobium sp.]